MSIYTYREGVDGMISSCYYRDIRWVKRYPTGIYVLYRRHMMMNGERLWKGCYVVAAVVPAKFPHEIVKYALVQGDTVVGTDLKTVVRVKTDTRIGEGCVLFKPFRKVADTLKRCQTQYQFGEGRLRVKWGDGASQGVFELPAQSDAEFPLFPMECNTLLHEFDLGSDAVEQLYRLSNCSSGEVSLGIGSGGVLCAKTEHTAGGCVDTSLAQGTPSMWVDVPAKVLHTLRRAALSEAWYVEVWDGSISFQNGSYTIQTRLPLHS